LPSEFVLFRAGENPSTKGSVLFDEQAALRVMGDAETYANDFAIDLEHRMVSPRLVDPNDSDTDAMGWHRLEVRNGELWAVRATWSAEGERRLRGRLQRYISPAFYVERDEATGAERVIQYINCALCSRPATHEMPPLVATAYVPERTYLDRGGRVCDAPASMSKDRDAMAAALASLDAGDATAAQSALRAAMAEPEEDPKSADSEPASAEDSPPAEPEDEEYTRARAAAIALAGDGVSDVFGAVRVLAKRAREAAGVADLGAAHAFMSSVLRERTEREAAERRSLVADLVTLGAETPATVAEEHVSASTLDKLRARVAALRARPAAPNAPVAPPAVAELDGLSAIEARAASQIKDPAHRERFISRCRSQKESAAKRK
jgi:hypothetical protein